MKSMKSVVLSSALILSAVVSSHAKAVDVETCMNQGKAPLSAFSGIIPSTTNTLACAAQGYADVQESQIRQEAAAVYFNRPVSSTPYLSAYIAIRGKKQEAGGVPSRELADKVLRSKPGTIAELLQREAKRQGFEADAAQK